MAETIHKQVIQLNIAVEIPSSGTARLKEENMAMMEIVAANNTGMNFFI
ncbi:MULTISPECIES: hypothetical protein [Pedobacter]|nr:MULTISPECIES: hypothetical protein [Pedobacter]